MIDPELQEVLAARQEAGLTAYWKLDPVEARQLYEGLPPGVRPRGMHVTERDVVLPGRSIRIRIYRPSGLHTPPVVVFFHGGGWMFCGLDTHDGVVASLAQSSQCVLISVEHRLAPEAPFPAAVNDGVEVTQWVARCDDLDVDRSRIAVAGDSSGANIAAVVALLARDAGEPAVQFQLLVYPVLDVSQWRDSYAANGKYGLNEDAMRWFVHHYVGVDGDCSNWRVSPLRVPCVEGLPPTRLVVGQYDVLRDEGLEYAERLAAAGVKVEVQYEPGMNHGFWSFPISRAIASIERAAAALGRALGAVR